MPAIPADATAIAREVIGDGLSDTSSPPMTDATISLGPPDSALGSGKFSKADNKLRVQLSIALDKTL